MSDYGDDFNQIIDQEFPMSAPPPPPAWTDPAPYGMPAHPPQAQAGLTKRGKAALAIGATVLAGGGLLGYEHFTVQAAATAAKSQELQVKQQQLELEKLKVLNTVNATNQKKQTSADQARQKQIDACVHDNKDLVGKQLGATYRSVVEDCQAQYGTTNTAPMESTSSAHGAGKGGGASNGALVGGGVLLLGIVVLARRGRRKQSQQWQLVQGN